MNFLLHRERRGNAGKMIELEYKRGKKGGARLCYLFKSWQRTFPCLAGRAGTRPNPEETLAQAEVQAMERRLYVQP